MIGLLGGGASEMAGAAATPTVGLDPTDTGLGSANARAVYRDLLRFGPRSRSELTTRLGLSAPTVTRTTRDLLDAGWLHTLGPVARTKGRPQEPLDIEENHGPRFIGAKVTAEEVHAVVATVRRSEEHTSELQSRGHLVCRLLLEKKNMKKR